MESLLINNNNVENVAILGLISSVLTEVFKFIPALRANAIIQAVVSIVVCAVVSFVANHYTFSIDNIVATIVFALVSYKVAIEPISSEAGLRSQE